MKRTIITVSIQLCLIMIFSFVSIYSIHISEEMTGIFRIVNYSGIVRGATQRIIKLENAHLPDDELIKYVDEILLELQDSNLGKYNLETINDPNFQAKLYLLEQIWEQVQEEIDLLRLNGGSIANIIKISEEHFEVANELVYLAEMHGGLLGDRLAKLKVFLILIVLVFWLMLVVMLWHFIKLEKETKRVEKETKKVKQKASLQKKKFLTDLEHLSYTDALTGLFNRNKYIQTIEKIVCEELDTVGIVYLDINGLKDINDNYGHDIGDKLMLKVANLIKENFDDNVFRIGGDEFVVLFIQSNHKEFETKALNLRTAISNYPEISVSLGIAWCANTDDIFKQITYADELMRIDKEKYYSEQKTNSKNYNPTAIINLQNDIKDDKFVIFLQPQIYFANEKISGAEALVRKKDENGGLIYPDKFISTYELDGVISYLDLLVLEKVCALLKEWKECGYPLIPISVNFSRKTILEHNIAKTASNICKKYGIEPNLITIELTEHISNISVENLNKILITIQSYGFKIALDDFGREYSNLSTLANLPFDEIKIDKTLIDNLTSNPSIKDAIYHTCKMCNSFRNTKMVVEGVETYEQVEILRELNCNLDIAQGYYFSKPLTIEDFLQYYKNQLP